MAPEEAAKKLLDKYLSVESCVDRVPLIMHGEENRKALKEHYGNKTDCKRTYEKMDTSDCKSPDDGYCYPVVTWGKAKNAFGGEYDDQSVYCIGKTPQGYLIDWRCSIGYNPLPLLTFTAQHLQGTAAVFRLQAKLSDYYNYEFSNAQKTHYAIELQDNNRKQVHGYVPRTSPDGTKIFDRLKDGKAHAMLLEIGYSTASKDAGVVEIRRLIGLGHRERPEEYERATPTPDR